MTADAQDSTLAPPPGPPSARGQVVALLGVDSVADAHRYGASLADDHANTHGRRVVHLIADPARRLITLTPPSADGTITYDLSQAAVEVPTAKGRRIDVAVGGLNRLEIADIVNDVAKIGDRVLLSGPTAALTQDALEFATLADLAIIVGGSDDQAARLAHILDQLAVEHRRVDALASVRKITPPGFIG